MKIAVFHNVTPGGAKRVVYEQVKALSRRHELYLFEYSSSDESFLDIRPFCKEVFEYKFQLESRMPLFFARIHKDYENFFLLSNLHKRIAEDIDSADFDICLVHPDKYTQAPFLLRYLKIPKLYFCEEYLRIAYEKELKFREEVSFLKEFYEAVTRNVRKRIDRSNAMVSSLVVANSLFTKNNIEKAYRIEAEYCHLGVDTKVFKPYSVKKENYLLFVGEKSVVESYDLVESALNLIVVKDRPRIKVLGLSKDKKFAKDDTFLAKEYSRAIATLCTQYNEPFGLSPIESMACETPVLAVNEGGYKETVLNGVTGFLLKRDRKVFAEKIVYLIKNPKVSREMGKEGRKHVKKNFSWEAHVDCVEKTLVEIAKQ